jgi:hypothetical protein
VCLERESAMDKDRVKGSAKFVKGRIKKAVGRAIGDTKLGPRARLTRSRARSRTLLAASKMRFERNDITGSGEWIVEPPS